MVQPSDSILSVSDLNRRAKMLLETQLNQLWVEGEISNLSQPSSGHWYFSLKDDHAHIRCAMFRNRNLLVKLKPKHGLKVKVRGRVSLYEPRGDYQLIVEAMEDDGEGLLQKQFELLKAKLAKEGLFEEVYKKALPTSASHIAVISSISGAAVHDILNVLKRRNPSIAITLIPSLVQGEGAAAQLIQSLNHAERLERLDAIIIGRGGGSLEDLSAFNDENLARKVFSMSIPIVSAVGHEIDFCITDFVADCRAPTPSAAAELLSSDVHAELAYYENIKQRLHKAIQNYLTSLLNKTVQKSKQLKHPGERITHWQQRTDICEQRLLNAINTRLSLAKANMSNGGKKLLLLQPGLKIAHIRSKLDTKFDQLKIAIQHFVNLKHERLSKSATGLDIVSPLSTLERGYSIARNQHGAIVNATSKISVGDELRVQVSDGEITAEVSNIHTNNELGNT